MLPLSVRALCLSALCASQLTIHEAAAQGAYTIRKLTAPGLAHGVASDIDDNGTVVGELLDAGGVPHPVVWRLGVSTQLATLPGGGSGRAMTIGSEGTIGGSSASSVTSGAAALWVESGNSWTALDLGVGVGPATGLFANVLGVHDDLAVGYVDDGILSLPAYWRSATTAPAFYQLPVPTWAFAGEAVATCGPAMVVGYVADFANSAPALWDVSGAPVLTVLPTLGGGGSVGDVNSSGVAAGSAFSTNTGFDHLVTWTNGAITDLGHLPGTDCYAAAISDQGDVVGWARTYSSPAFVAVVKRADESIVDLNSLLPPQSGWTLVRALGINDEGVIVGTGIKDGFFEPFAMMPTRVALEPPQPGAAGLANTFAVTGATPGATVYYCVAITGGETEVAGCFEGLDLAAPLVFGAAVADVSGAASVTVPVPAFLGQVPLLFQAYDYVGCATSNVVAHTF